MDKDDDDAEMAALEAMSSGARRSRVGAMSHVDVHGRPTSTLDTGPMAPRAPGASSAPVPARSTPNGMTRAEPNVGLLPRQLREIAPGSEEELRAESEERAEREAARAARASHEETRARLRR